MPFIPCYFDGYVQALILALWILIGAIAVVEGRRKLLPANRLWRRGIRAAIGAFISIGFYALYVIQRQNVEARDRMVFGTTSSHQP